MAIRKWFGPKRLRSRRPQWRRWRNARSSPAFKHAYPAAAALYLQKADVGLAIPDQRHGADTEEPARTRKSPVTATIAPTRTKWHGPRAKCSWRPAINRFIRRCSRGSIRRIQRPGAGVGGRCRSVTAMRFAAMHSRRAVDASRPASLIAHILAKCQTDDRGRGRR